MKLTEIKLGDLRREAGLTQVQLAELSDITRVHIAKIEGRNIENCSLKTITDYLYALGYEVQLKPMQGDKSAWKKLI